MFPATGPRGENPYALRTGTVTRVATSVVEPKTCNANKEELSVGIDGHFNKELQGRLVSQPRSFTLSQTRSRRKECVELTLRREYTSQFVIEQFLSDLRTAKFVWLEGPG